MPDSFKTDAAFTVFTDHIVTFLDVSFAITLGRYILDNGAENKALLAFAHKLLTLETITDEEGDQ